MAWELARRRCGVALLALAAAAAPAARAQDDACAAVIRRVTDAGEHPWLRSGRFADHQADVRRVYETSQYASLWLRDGRPTVQATDVVAAFFDAEARGLSASDYDAERLRREAERLAAGDAASPDDQGLFDTAVTVAAMRYAAALYIGRINPRSVEFGYDVAPKKLDLPAVTAELAQAASPRERLAKLDPPFPLFARLQEALAQYRGLAARTDLPPVPELGKLRPGDLSPDLPALRARLEVLGDLPAGAGTIATESTGSPGGPDPLVYDEALAEGVRHFQRRHGLETDAIIGKATLRALQVPPQERVKQIQLAMERLRWLPYTWPDRFIIVNIPEFRLRGFQAGSDTPPLAMNVVVGEAAKTHKTPVLHADMTHVVFRPYWSVPPGIARREILPKVDRDPDYLMRNEMEMIDGRVRQRPGRRNSLGLVKFILPNPHHVYLHDTPSKGLFARSRRDFSHGCIRVADPPGLAAFVFEGQEGWDRARIEKAMARGPNDRRVDLQSPVPVYLFYTTVVVDQDGTINFFEDIYQHDFTLESALAKGYPYTS